MTPKFKHSIVFIFAELDHPVRVGPLVTKHIGIVYQQSPFKPHNEMQFRNAIKELSQLRRHYKRRAINLTYESRDPYDSETTN